MMSLGRYWALLRTYLAEHRPKVAALGVLVLGMLGLDLARPMVVRRFVDAAVGGAPVDALTAEALLYIGIAVVMQLAGVLRTYLAEDVGWATTNALRADLALHCLKLDMPFHLKHTPGQLIERIDGDVASLANFFSRLALSFVSTVLLLVGSLVVIATVDVRIALIFLVFAGVGVAILRATRNVGVPFNQVDRETAAGLFGFIQERLSGTEDVRARGAAPYVLRGLWVVMRARMRARAKAGAVGMAQWGTTILLGALATALIFALGGSLHQAGAISIGTVIMLIGYASLVTRPMNQLSQQLEELQRATAGITRVQELLDQSTALTSVEGNAADRASLPQGPLGVALEGVSFAYPDQVLSPKSLVLSQGAGGSAGPSTGSGRTEMKASSGGTALEAVLQDVSFTLAPGRVLGLLGRTGSGKTTLTRLLLRLYDPSAGAVRLGGVDLRHVSPRAVRDRVAMVTQEVQLFAASVRDNLTFFNREIEDARLVEALTALGLDGWLRALPQGLDTPLAAGGTGLSAGEAQLLAFARAFLRDPGLVILDEASSRLDPATERRIERAVDVLLAGRTAIVVAHRLATVQRADEILILEGGRIAEHGPRAALGADAGSRFAGLLRTGLEVAFA